MREDEIRKKSLSTFTSAHGTLNQKAPKLSMSIGIVVNLVRGTGSGSGEQMTHSGVSDT